MSDTPRTNAAWNKLNHDDSTGYQMAVAMKIFAKQLERELARALKLAEDNGKLAHQTACELAEALENLEAVKREVQRLRIVNDALDESNELSEAQKQRDALAKSLMRLHEAADVFAADQSNARDERCGLVQPVTVAECEELNQALKVTWELLNQSTGTAEQALPAVKGGSDE
jgi:ABC-type thiamine transport system ATPase subunit